MILRRFFSKAVREAIALRKHVMRQFHAQRDLMTPLAVSSVQEKVNELDAAIKDDSNTGKIRIKAEELQFAGEKWIKPYPNPAFRENVEVLLVAIAVAMGIRTFFLQPFKIPTASMQPTLYGITSAPDFTQVTAMLESNGGDFNSPPVQAAAAAQVAVLNSIVIPSGFERVKEWLRGYSYIHFVAPADGSVEDVKPPWPGTFISLSQKIEFAGQWYTIFLPPDCGEEPLQWRSGLMLARGRVYHKGDDVIKLRVHAGDHLFVDRFTYNFRAPQRGEIVVFQTAGIPEDQRDMWRIAPDQFYIKRLVGLGGETISLQRDYDVADSPLPGGGIGPLPAGHLVVNGQPLSASTPHFENLYSFYGAKPGTNTLVYREDEYYGHAMVQRLAPGDEVHIAPGNSFMMGDNTMNSLDSRYWGDIPSSSIIGKSFFVYWPLTRRFGLNGQ